MAKNSISILIVEDNRPIVDLLTKKLQDEGMRALSATDGQEALDILDKEHVDLVLLDIDLPLMSGLMVGEKMKQEERWKNIPVIVISNTGSPEDIEYLKRIGIEDYFIKADLDPEEIVGKIYAQLKVKGRVDSSGVSEEGGDVESKQTEDTSDDSEKKKSSPGGSSKKILLVEDNEFLRKLLVKKLSSYNFEIIESIDGETAVDMLDKEKNLGLILLDIVLPEMDGFVVLQEIRKHPVYKKVPVVVISNLGQDAEVKKAMDLGANDYIIKAHFTPGEIVEKINEYMK